MPIANVRPSSVFLARSDFKKPDWPTLYSLCIYQLSRPLTTHLLITYYSSLITSETPLRLPRRTEEHSESYIAASARHPKVPNDPGRRLRPLRVSSRQTPAT